MVCKMRRFVNNLRISTVDVMVSSSFPTWSLVSKGYHFEYFPMKYPVIIEMAGLRPLMLFIRMSRESQKVWNCSIF